MHGASIAVVVAAVAVVGACIGQGSRSLEQGEGNNPLLGFWSTPFEAPPFDDIRAAHFPPAFERGMLEQKAEISAIMKSSEPASFENTIEPLERSGSLLDRINSVFSNLRSAHTNEEIQAIAAEINPRLARHRDDIYLDSALFVRVRSVYERRAALDLAPEQRMLLEQTYLDFVRGGVNLEQAERNRFREINEELSELSTRFGDNRLVEMNAIALLLDDEEDLVGLPDSVRATAAETATARGEPGKWGFTLQRTSWTPFLQYSQRRDLREQLYGAYLNLGNNDDDYDNKDIAARIAALRAERARLLGYETHAHYVLEQNMAERPGRVYELLGRLWTPALARARQERAELQALVDQEGGEFDLAMWDWWYYAEKLRVAKYEFDEETVRPYLQLENVRQAAFDVAGRLLGIAFEERTEVPVYHPDVRVFEVTDRDGSHLALFYVDYFARPGKRGGAWMSNYREQWKQGGRDVRPIVVNVCNFAKPPTGTPALLSLDEARTLFHEFGHALHGMLADGSYRGLSGTNVPRDFVELPSQMMENWALAPEVLPSYARHYETGEPIPKTLIEKLERAERFNQGFTTTEYLAASFLDMEWHSLGEAIEVDPLAFEGRVMERIQLIPQIAPRYRTPFFNHIFAGGYAAGYYSYVWAEVLDAHGFEAFREAGLFDPGVARSYRENILEKGYSEPPMELYRRFRGSEPTIEPLLLRRGLTGEG